MSDDVTYPRFRLDVLREHSDTWRIFEGSYCDSMDEAGRELERARRRFPMCQFRITDEEQEADMEMAADLMKFDPRPVGEGI